jgi:rhodanese-related sulfurtransferase
MESPEAIVARARARGLAKGLPYDGAMLPREAYELLQQVAAARMVDVRTDAEWSFVGHAPDSVLVEWSTWPSGEYNERFLEELRAAVPSMDSPVLFLCRSGARSHHAAAAATKAGFKNCYNVLEGFEGDRDANDHRSSVGGWRFAGLPWVQS